MHKLIIEVALNEAMSKALNPNIPYGLDEVVRDTVACARAGATIIHFHSRDPKTGEDTEGDLETYAETMKAVQRECDVIISPSYPVKTMEERIGFLERLGDYPGVRLEFAGHGVGSTSAVTVDPRTKELKGPSILAPAQEVLKFAQAMHRRRVRILLGCRDVGHLRHVRALLDAGAIEPPLFFNLFLSEEGYFGPSPDARGLMMYLDMIPPATPHQWMVSAYKSPTLEGRINMLAVAMGGHVRTGLGEAPLHDGKKITNADHVQRLADLAHRADRGIATPAEARQMLGIAPLGNR